VKDYSFSVFPNLEFLELSGCHNLSIVQPRAFYGPSIVRLDFSNNNLKTPSRYWFDSFHCDVSAMVDFVGNPWLCDCDAYEYQMWINGSCFDFHKNLPSQIECSYPAEFEGMSLNSIGKEEVCTAPATTTAVSDTSTEKSSSSFNILEMKFWNVLCSLYLFRILF